MEFSDQLVQRIQSNILNQISSANFIDTGYNSPKVQIGKNFLDECYAALDMEKVKLLIIERLEKEVADRIVTSLLTEYANDVKQIMSNKELREDLRGILRDKIKEVKTNLEQ